MTFLQFLKAPFKDVSVDQAGGFIRSNFFFLLWILFVPLLLLGMKQGWELLYGLFDDTGMYPGLRAAAMLIAYFLLAMAIWLLPLPFFPKVDREVTDINENIRTWNRLRPVTGNNPHRALLVSTLPIGLYSLVMIWVQAMRGLEWWQWGLTIVTVAAGVYGMYWVMERSKLKIGAVQFWLCMNWLLVFVLILIGKSARLLFWNYYFVGVCTLIQIALLGGLFKHLEAGFQGAYRRAHRRYYRSVFFSVVIATLGLSLVNNLNFLTPTFVLLLIITFYVLLNDLVIAVYILKKGKWIKYGLTGLLLVLGWFVLIHSSKIHNVNYVEAEGLSAGDRVGFQTYFQKWYETNIQPGVDTNGTAEIPVFLIAAQGGGSRAGLWTSQILNRLESGSGFQFHRHLFAVTSASGGSAGTGATLAFWRYLLDHPEIDSTTRSRLCEHFAAGMFSRNYLSSQFMQLFVNEVGKRVYRLFSEDVFDRNYEHQRHEVLGFATAIRFSYENTREDNLSPFDRILSSFKNGVHDSLNIGGGRPPIPNYPMRPYLSYWYDAPGKPNTSLPLYFPITTHIQTGRSGYAGPLDWEPRLFVDAIDIMGEAEKADKHQPKRSLALVTTSNLSQLFPAMNGYTYIDGVGNFMDGGLFENMGLTLMNSLYARLDSAISDAGFIHPKLKKRLKIRMLFIINDDLEPWGKPQKQLNQSLATFKAVGFSSIQGQSTWWQDYFNTIVLSDNNQTMARDNPAYKLVLQGPGTPARDQVPLGRWLSKRSVDSVCARVEHLPLCEVLGPLCRQER